MKNVMAYCLLITALCGCNKGNTGNGNNPNPPADPAISIDDLSLFEGNGGTNTFNIVVKLSTSSSKTVSVQYNTTDGFAKAGEDYTAASNQTLTFQPGETQKNIAVSVVADDIKEGDDDFKVVLSSPVNATIQTGTSNVIIRNDDSRINFTNNGYDAPTTYSGYTLVWADEFNTGTLDANAWSFENGDGCPNVCGWGNNEQEYYRPDNLFFQDGKMIIEGKKENYGGKNYTSSKILTRGKKVFKFGRIDIRAQLPKGKGMWPAFWLLPQNNVYGNWPTSGEIDLMEMIGNEPNRSYATVHYGPGPGSTQIGRNYTLPSGVFNDSFHVFSLEWKLDQVKWYIDGNLFSTVNKSDIVPGTTWPFNEDFFLIFNLAIGGSWPGNPDATTYFPQWLIVDYIRVYQ